MGLRPLHFSRGLVRHGGGGTARIGALYGRNVYATDCGRFILNGFEEGWGIHARLLEEDYVVADVLAWHEWLGRHGLMEARFDTRRETLEVLESVLRHEGLFESPSP